MKNFCKWFLFVTVIVATVLCFVFPVQAKEISENIMNVLNTPVGIAGVSTTIGGILAFIVTKFVMTNSKFGRKELDNIKKEFDEFQNAAIEHQQALTMKISDYEDKFNNLKNNCEDQVKIVISEFEDLQKDTLNALKTIPNKKVQAIVCEYENNYESRKAEIIEKVSNSDEYINNKLNELRKEFEEMLNEAKETFNNETEAA